MPLFSDNCLDKAFDEVAASLCSTQPASQPYENTQVAIYWNEEKGHFSAVKLYGNLAIMKRRAEQQRNNTCLPHPIWEKIFGHLSLEALKLRKVCRYFAGRHFSDFYRDIIVRQGLRLYRPGYVFSPSPYYESIIGFRSLIERIGAAKILNTAFFTTFDDYFVEKERKYISGPCLYVRDCLALVPKVLAPSSLSSVFIRNREELKLLLKSFDYKLPWLASINLCAKDMRISDIVNLFKAAPNLSSFICSGSDHFGLSDLNQLNRYALKLEFVWLAFWDAPLPGLQLTINAFPKLNVLRMFNVSITSSDLKVILKAAPQLRGVVTNKLDVLFARDSRILAKKHNVRILCPLRF